MHAHFFASRKFCINTLKADFKFTFIISQFLTKFWFLDLMLAQLSPSGFSESGFEHSELKTLFFCIFPFALNCYSEYSSRFCSSQQILNNYHGNYLLLLCSSLRSVFVVSSKHNRRPFGVPSYDDFTYNVESPCLEI